MLMSFSLNSMYSSGFRDFSNKKMTGADTFWLPLFFFFLSQLNHFWLINKLNLQII